MENSHLPAILVFQNVKKAFGKIIALDDISFEISKGEIVFITGHSGAGKSTLLKLITREISSDSGKIILSDCDVCVLTNKEIPAYRQKIGVVFQDYKILPERTVRENIEVALAVINVSPKEWRGRVDQVLKLVGLTDRSELFPSQLSGGEIQRVSLSRALVTNPQMILADEPTGNLDWKTSDSIMDLLLTINKEGKTILVATHNQMLIDKHKQVRVIELSNGRLKSDKK